MQTQCSPCAAKLRAGSPPATLNPVGLSNTVSSAITAVRAPTSVKTDEQFTIEVDIETTGTGSDKQFLAVYDSDAAKYIGAGISDEPLGPGMRGTWTATMKPLKDWYASYTGRPIPQTLNWIARVGYVTKEVEGGFEGVITDQKSFSISTPTAPPPKPEDYKTEETCEAAGYYWYDNACHSEPLPWWKRKVFGVPVVYLAAGGAVAVGVAAAVAVARK
jgi:hypothetical protein